MRNTLISLFLLFCASAFAQLRDTTFIRSHAIPIADLRDPGDKIYNDLKQYRAILIGECHGSQEPAQFVEGIARTFLDHHRRVIIGMEIPASAMDGFDGSRSSLAGTKFFTQARKWEDGRASEAWASLLLAFRDSSVRYVFFDETAAQSGVSPDRDSFMYENINAALRGDTNAVFISISGGYHNQFSDRRYGTPMGWYLRYAINSAIKDTSEMLSLDHIFDEGTVNANMGEPSEGPPGPPTGLKLHSFSKGQSGYFGRIARDEKYMLIGEGHSGYSGILFTRTVHASPLLVE